MKIMGFHEDHGAGNMTGNMKHPNHGFGMLDFDQKHMDKYGHLDHVPVETQTKVG